VVIALAVQALSDCEAVSWGFLAQPANAISSLALVAASAWLVARSPSWMARGMAASLVVAGVGSFAYHGPQPSWSAAVHDAGVVLVAVAAGAVSLIAVMAGRLRVLAPPMVVLGAGLVFDLAGRTSGILCFPGSLLQAHAAWHALAAVGLAMLARRVAVTREERLPTVVLEVGEG
jgi:hypothetical protein